MKRTMSFLLAVVLFAGLVLTGAPRVYAASEMKVSDELVEIVKQEEGFSAKPYWDYGQYTVGYGTRCPDDMLEEYKKNGISKEAAEVLLRNYLTKTENTINKKFIDKYGLKLTQGQFDALVTFTYNCGSGWISETGGTFHNAVKKGKTGSELINAFTLWCSAGGQILPGLVRRRLSEANMWLNGKYSRSKPDNYCYVYYNANGGSVSYRIQGYDANEGVAPAYTPTNSGRTFLGWYTSQTGGTKVTKLTKSLSGDTLYARWEGKEEDTPTTPTEGIQVTVTASDVNLRKGPGTNYSIVGTAEKGDKMTITETASGSGYQWGNADGKWIALKFTDYDQAVKEPEKKPEATEPETTEPETTVPEETKPEETKPEETKPEETKVTGKIKASGGLAMRNGPGTGYKVVKYLKNGSKVTILEQKTVGSMTWGKVDGGWISMKYVVLDQPETTKPADPEPTVPETTKPADPEPTVPETTKPADPEPTVPETTKPADPEPTVPETTKPADPEPTVPETTKPADPEPTVPETTKPAEPETTKLTGKVKASGGLAVRKGPGSSYGVKKYLSNGTKVTITEVQEVKGTKWGKISSGWISMSYVVLDGQKEDASNVKTVTADCLRVRKSASTTAKIVGYYYEGEKVTILETKKVSGTTWGKTNKGWISMAYVK